MREKKKTTTASEYVSLVKQIRFTPLKADDPIAHLELRRHEYIERMELIADEARAEGDPDMELKALAFLIRLTSAFKSRVDVSSTQLGLVKMPELTGLSDDELKRLEHGDPLITNEMKDKLS